MKKRIDIITIFPEACEQYLKTGMIGRAVKSGIIEASAHNLRDFSPDKKHRKVDDRPFGGGPGMIMMVEPFDRAVKKIRKHAARVILTSAAGKKFTQKDAIRLSKYDQLIFLCGRYEGVDYRVEKYIADEAFSIGDYVLTGGELPALVIADAIARHIPGVLGKEESLEIESHAQEGILEYPQYTRPEVYLVTSDSSDRTRETGLGKRENQTKRVTAKVPKVLISGDHKRINEWRLKHQKHRS